MFEKLKNYFRGNVASTRYEAVPVGQGKRFTVDANGDVVYATCIKILSEAVAQTEWNIYGTDNKQVTSTMNLFNKCLNISPYDGINAYDFWEYIERQRLSTGNGIAYMRFNEAGILQQLVPLDSSCVTVYWDNANILEGKRKLFYEYRDSRDGKVYTMLPEEVFHVKANSANGIVGIPSIKILLNTLRGNALVDSSIYTSVDNNFFGTIVLSYTSDLNLQRRKEVQTQIKELLSDSNSTILPLPVGMSANPIPNGVDKLYEVLKNVNAQKVTAFFGIPLSMINSGVGSGMASFSANQLTSYHSQTIAPIIRRYSKELTLKLLTRRQLGFGYRFDSADDTFDYLDAQAKASVLASYVGAGILTANEARTSVLYPASDDPMANKLTQRGGTGALGDGGADEGGHPEKNEEEKK